MLRFPHAKGDRFKVLAHYLQNIQVSIIMILTVLMIGVVGFIFFENYTFGEAFYMTIITVSTVGFGEVQPLSSEGRLFVSILIITNIGIFAYAISTITAFILDGKLNEFLKDFRVFRRIDELNNHVIVCGIGRHGKEVVEELAKQGIAFVVIERAEEQVEELREMGNVLYIKGDATHEELLEEAGVERASALVSTLGDDAENLYIVLSARQINPNIKIISRASSLNAEIKLKRVGANSVVLPERIGGFYMANLVNKPDVVEFFNLLSNMGNTYVGFEEVHYQSFKNEYKDKSIRQLNIRGLTGANIIGIHTPNEEYIVNPGPDVVIEKGTILVVLGDKKQMKAFKEILLN